MTRLALLAAALLAGCSNDTGDARAPVHETAEAETKPTLALLTTLPIMFSGEFSIEQAGSPLLRALERDYDVQAIAATDAGALAGKDVLFMAHALPQTADNLVALDAWVRGGGKVLLLADPQLDWDAGLPLGHAQAPPFFFGDTGLLGHWGLALSGPSEDAARGDIQVSHAGTLAGEDDSCTIALDGLVAHCEVGRGKASVIADADFLAADQGAGIALVEAELHALTR